MEIPNPGRSTVALQGLDLNHRPSAARLAVQQGTTKPMLIPEVKRHLRELSKLLYAHKKMAPYYHSDVCNGKSALAFCLCAVHGQSAPQPLAPHTRDTSVSNLGSLRTATPISEKRKSSPCKNVRPGSTCELPDLLEGNADLASWDSLYYALSAEIRQLYRDIAFRMGSGFADHSTILHQFGWAAALREYGQPFTLLNLATILERGWDIINRKDLVATLDLAVRDRNAKLLPTESDAKEFLHTHVTPINTTHRNLFINTEGLLDINRLAPEMIIGMLWHEQGDSERYLNDQAPDSARAPPGDIIHGVTSPREVLTSGDNAGKVKTSPAHTTNSTSAAPTTPPTYIDNNTTMDGQLDGAGDDRPQQSRVSLPHCTCLAPCWDWYFKDHFDDLQQCIRTKIKPIIYQSIDRRLKAAAALREQEKIDRELREIEERRAELLRNREAFSRQQEELERLATAGQIQEAAATESGQYNELTRSLRSASIGEQSQAARQYADRQSEAARQLQQRSRAGSNLGHLAHVPDTSRPKTPAGGRRLKDPVNLELYGEGSGQRYPSEAMARPSVTAQPPPVYGQTLPAPLSAASLLSSRSDSTIRAPSRNAAAATATAQEVMPDPNTPTRDSSSEGLFTQSVRRSKNSQTSLSQHGRARRGSSQAIEDDDIPEDLAALQPAPLRVASNSQQRDASRGALAQRIERESQEQGSGETGSTLRPSRIRAGTQESNTGQSYFEVPRASTRPYGYGGYNSTAVTDYGTYSPYHDDQRAAPGNAVTTPDQRAIPRSYDQQDASSIAYPNAYNDTPSSHYYSGTTGTSGRTPESQVPSYHERTSDHLPYYTTRGSDTQHLPTSRRPSNFKTPENVRVTETGFDYPQTPSDPPSAYHTAPGSQHVSHYGSLAQSRSNSSSNPHPLFGGAPPMPSQPMPGVPMQQPKQRYVSAGGPLPLNKRIEVASPFDRNAQRELEGAKLFPAADLTERLSDLQKREMEQAAAAGGKKKSMTPKRYQMIETGREALHQSVVNETGHARVFTPGDPSSAQERRPSQTGSASSQQHTPIRVPIGGQQEDKYNWEKAFADGELEKMESARANELREREMLKSKEKPRKESMAGGSLKGIKKRLFSRSGSENKDGGGGDGGLL